MDAHRGLTLFSLLIRSFSIAVLSAIVGVAFNAVSPWKIPYIYHPPQSVKLSGGQVRIVDLSEAYTLFQNNNTVFVDARSEDYYRKGHIKGALSLPSSNADAHLDAVLQKITQDATLVTYCHGQECDESHRVADILMQLGYQNVIIFASGFPAWQSVGYPVETGDGRTQ